MARFVLIASFLVLIVGFLSGCATPPEGQPTINEIQAQNGFIEITGRNLAYGIGRNNPKIIEPGIAFCSAITAEGVDLSPLVAEGIKYLDLEVADYPFLKEDLESLLKIFNIPVLGPGETLTDRQKEMVLIAAQAMKRGFEQARDNPKVSWADFQPWCL